MPTATLQQSFLMAMRLEGASYNSMQYVTWYFYPLVQHVIDIS